MGRDKMKSASLHSFHEEHTEPLPPVPAAGARTSFESLVREMLDQLGEDPSREGLRQTPARVETCLKWLTRGYHMSVADVIAVVARRLQVQERLTDQVADALMEVLDPRGVGVVIEAYHLCMMMRGVEKQNSKTVTSALRGALLQDAKTRDEFLRLVYSRGPG